MEHNEKCERISTVERVKNRVQLSRAEVQALCSPSMPMEISCYCLERLGWPHGSVMGPLLLQQRTVEFVFRARRARHGNGLEGEVLRKELLNVQERVEDFEGRVIEVDFRNRRKRR